MKLSSPFIRQIALNRFILEAYGGRNHLKVKYFKLWSIAALAVVYALLLLGLNLDRIDTALKSWGNEQRDCSKAVSTVVDADNERDGVEASYDWLFQETPGAHVEEQAFVFQYDEKAGRTRYFDLYILREPGWFGGRKHVCMEITNWFGKP